METIFKYPNKPNRKQENKETETTIKDLNTKPRAREKPERKRTRNSTGKGGTKT